MKTLLIIHQPGAAIYALQAPDVPPPGTAVVVTAEEFLAIDAQDIALEPIGGEQTDNWATDEREHESA